MSCDKVIFVDVKIIRILIVYLSLSLSHLLNHVIVVPLTARRCKMVHDNLGEKEERKKCSVERRMVHSVCTVCVQCVYMV